MEKSFVYLFEGMFLYAGKRIPSYTHENHSLEISVSLDDPFLLIRDDGASQTAECILIAPDSSHQCIAPYSGNLAHIGIDPEHRIAAELHRKYLKDSTHAYSQCKISEFKKEMKSLLQNQSSPSQMHNLVNRFLLSLIGSEFHSASRSEMDPRIQKLTVYLKKSSADFFEKKFTLKELAQSVNLSDGRLVHLFKEETGIPIRRYILWLRLNSALQEIGRSLNLTEAAHHAGFSDSAHFSRTFVRMFGIPPSEILKNSQIIQAETADI